MNNYDLRLAVLNERAIRDGRVWTISATGHWIDAGETSPWFYTETEKDALIEVRRTLPSGLSRGWREHRGPCHDECICGGINSPIRWVCSAACGGGGYTAPEMDAIKKARLQQVTP